MSKKTNDKDVCSSMRSVVPLLLGDGVINTRQATRSITSAMRDVVNKQFPYNAPWEYFKNGKFQHLTINDYQAIALSDNMQIILNVLFEILSFMCKDITIDDIIEMEDITGYHLSTQLALGKDIEFGDRYIYAIVIVSVVLYMLDDEDADDDKIRTEISAKALMAMLYYTVLCKASKVKNSIVKRLTFNIAYKDMLAFSKLYSGKRIRYSEIFDGAYIVGLYGMLRNDQALFKKICSHAIENDEDAILDLSLASLVIKVELERKNRLLQENGKMLKKIQNLTKKVEEVRRPNININTDTSEIRDLKSQLADKERELDSLYSNMDDLASENMRLMSRLETAQGILDTYKKEDASSYEEHEIQSIIDLDEVDLSKLNICLICSEQFAKQFKYYVYDYIKAPSRIDMLNKYDLIVIITSSIQHKHSIGVTNYCRIHGIEFMYSSVTNNDRLDDEIRGYAKFKGLV